MIASDEELIAKVDELIAIVKRVEKKLSGPATASGGVSSDRDLDSQYGNPVVRKDPKRWDANKGSYVGCKFSECPADYLDEVASFKEWQAQMDERKGTEDDLKKAKFCRLDAARARGWAQRIRSGWQPTAVEQPSYNGDDPPF